MTGSQTTLQRIADMPLVRALAPAVYVIVSGLLINITSARVSVNDPNGTREHWLGLISVPGALLVATTALYCCFVYYFQNRDITRLRSLITERQFWSEVQEKCLSAVAEKMVALVDREDHEGMSKMRESVNRMLFPL